MEDRKRNGPETATPNGSVSESGEDLPHVLLAGALYPGCERGLAADILAARALDLTPQVVCSGIVAAGRGHVTDVVEVPADTVSAQLEHIRNSGGVAAGKIGMLGSAPSAEVFFRHMEAHSIHPLILDVKLSGPSGEDIADGRTIEILKHNFSQADLVSVGKLDAELLASMHIDSLDDAQVAVQRLVRLGARSVLLRCGNLPARFFESQPTDDFFVDLFFDGDDFVLFEAPLLPHSIADGASSGLAIATLKNLIRGNSLTEALQFAKGFVTESIRHSYSGTVPLASNFFWAYGQETSRA